VRIRPDADASETGLLRQSVDRLYSNQQVIRALGRVPQIVARGAPAIKLLAVFRSAKKTGGGMSLIEVSEERRSNPVDVVEHLAAIREWSFDRAGDDEIAISITGRWTDYHLSFTWMDEIEALHLACAFDCRVPERRRAEVLQLIAQVNEQLWVGHFDLWSRDGVIMFRHALILAGGMEPSGRQCEVLLEAALDACERYYQAFQFVVWAGKGAREAMDAAMFDTAGEA